MSSYRVKVTRDGKYWIVDIDGVGVTQARRLSEVEEMAVDYIAAIEEVAPETVAIVQEIEVPADVKAFVDRAAAERVEADAARDRANAASTAAAVALRDKGLTVREIGPVLGVSFQRAQQLLTAEARELAAV